MGGGHLERRELVAVVFKEVTHGQFVASVVPSATLTVQVQGVLIQSARIHYCKGQVHLKAKAKKRGEDAVINCSRLYKMLHFEWHHVYMKMHTYKCSAGIRCRAVEVAGPIFTAGCIQVLPQAVWGGRKPWICLHLWGLWSSTSENMMQKNIQVSSCPWSRCFMGTHTVWEVLKKYWKGWKRKKTLKTTTTYSSPKRPW